VREEAKFAGKENNQMRRGQSVKSTGAVLLVNYKYKEILYVGFHTQHAV